MIKRIAQVINDANIVLNEGDPDSNQDGIITPQEFWDYGSDLDYSSYIPDPIVGRFDYFDASNQDLRRQQQIINNEIRDEYYKKQRDREPIDANPWETLKRWYQSAQDHSHGRGPR